MIVKRYGAGSRETKELDYPTARSGEACQLLVYMRVLLNYYVGHLVCFHIPRMASCNVSGGICHSAGDAIAAVLTAGEHFSTAVLFTDRNLVVATATEGAIRS